MNPRTISTTLLASAAIGLGFTAGQESESLGLYGSGTTNPSKCFWHIMAKFQEQIKIPV
jgi:hypothetical protein